jgi:hypothetical protein
MLNDTPPKCKHTYATRLLRDKYAPIVSVVSFHYLRTDPIRDAILTGAGNAFANTSRSVKS